MLPFNNGGAVGVLSSAFPKTSPAETSRASASTAALTASNSRRQGPASPAVPGRSLSDPNLGASGDRENYPATQSVNRNANQAADSEKGRKNGAFPSIVVPRSGSVKTGSLGKDDDIGNLSDVSTSDGSFEDVRGPSSPREEVGAPQSSVSLSAYVPSRSLRKSKTVRFTALCKIVYYDEDGPTSDLQHCR